MRRNHLIAAISCFLLCGFGECQQRDAVTLVGHGYTLLSPPSNLFAPGAIVLMTTDEQGRAQLKLVCGPRGSLSSAWLPRVSETMSSSMKMSRSQKIHLEADAVDRFRARTSMMEVQSVSVDLSNPRIIEAPEESIYAHISSRSEACTKAIDARQAAGYHPTFVTSAYIADIEYTVHFKNEWQMSKRAKEEKMAQVAAKLGGGHTEVRSTSMKAVNLILALKADEWLMQIQPDGKMAPLPENPARQLDAVSAEALPGSESPLIAPEGGWVSPIMGN